MDDAQLFDGIITVWVGVSSDPLIWQKLPPDVLYDTLSQVKAHPGDWHSVRLNGSPGWRVLYSRDLALLAREERALRVDRSDRAEKRKIEIAVEVQQLVEAAKQIEIQTREES